jgi:hypothetical protein
MTSFFALIIETVLSALAFAIAQLIIDRLIGAAAM